MASRLRRNQLVENLEHSAALESRVMLMGAGKAPAVQTFTDTILQDTADEKSDSKYTKSGNIETFVVAEGENKTRNNGNDPNFTTANGLDARVENGFKRRIQGDATKDHVFKGSYEVVSAKDTTIFQILNNDKSDPDGDLNKPVVFIEAETFGKNQVKLTQEASTDGRKEQIYSGSNKFNLRVKVEDYKNKNGNFAGQQADIFINNKSVSSNVKFDRDQDKKGNQVPSRDSKSTVRYGAYHHDRRTIPKAERDRATRNKTTDSGITLESASKAEIKVTDARLEVQK